MDDQTKHFLGYSTVFLIAALVISFISLDIISFSTNADKSGVSGNDGVAGEVSVEETKDASGDGRLGENGTVEDADGGISIDVPDLNRPIVFPDSMPERVQEDLKNKIENTVQVLEENHDAFNQWMDLGLYRKAIEDYDGAREAWEYASAIRTKNAASFGNLGELYAYFLHDNVKAEENYLRAIKNAPKEAYFYAQAYEFYREAVKDDTKAKTILERAVETLTSDQSEPFRRELEGLQ